LRGCAIIIAEAEVAIERQQHDLLAVDAMGRSGEETASVG
jgi:hypothetical protein